MKVIYSKRTNVRKIAGVFIIPGVNVLEDEAANKVINSPDYKEDNKINLKADGDKSAAGSGDQGADASELKLNAKDMIAAVKEMESVTKLNTLLENEERSSVIKAIEKRIDAINAARDGDGEDE